MGEPITKTLKLAGKFKDYATSAEQAAANAQTRADDAYNLADTANKKVDTLREVVSQLHSNIVCTSEGEIITLSDSAEASLQGLKLFGKTEQYTTTGKNLWPHGDIASGGSYGLELNLPAGTYAISREDATSQLTFRFFTTPNLTDTESSLIWTMLSGVKTQTLTANTMIYGCNTNVLSGNACTNVQIEKNSTATAYEPYTGGIPSPNPEYPQELESVGDGGSVTTTVCGKNLLDVNSITNHYYTNEGVKTEHNYFALFGWIPVKQGQKLAFSAKYVGSDGEYLRWAYFDTGKNFISRHNAEAKKVNYILYPPANGYVRVFFSTNNYDINTAQLTYGDTVQDFEAFNGGHVTVTPVDSSGNSLYLPGIPVTSGGNYTDETGQQWICDEVDFKKGVYVQRVKKIVMDGSTDEGWREASSGRAFTTIVNILPAKNNDSVGAALCSALPNVAANDLFNNTSLTGICVRNGGDIGIRINETYAIEDTLTWLNDNPMTVHIAMAECIEHELTAEALAQYAALHTNYPNTTVYNNAGAHMEVGYIADTKLYVDNKFAELAAALVNNI